MATIGNLVVAISARTGRFVSGIRKSEQRIRRFDRKVQAVSKRIGRFGAALTTAALGGGITIFTKTQFEAIDATQKFADRLGIGVEQLQVLQRAGELTGVSVNQLQLGMQRMTRRVAEAAQGTGEAQGALKTLGLDAEKLAGMLPDQQFAAVSQAMQGVESQSERVRLAFKLFDSEGVALVNTLNLSQQELQGIEQEMRRTGEIVSETAGRDVEAFNDAMTRLKGSATGLGRSFLTQMAPMMTKAIQGVQFVVENFGDLWRVVGLRIAIFAVDLRDDFMTAATNISIAFKFVRDNFMTIITDMGRALLSFAQNTSSNIVKLFGSIPGLITGELDLSEVLDTLNSPLEGFKAELKDLPQFVKNEGSALSQGLRQTLEETELRLGEGLMAIFSDQTQQFKNQVLDPAADIKEEIEKETALSRSGASALQRGSSGAANAVANFLNRQGDKELRVAKDQLNQDKKHTALLGKINQGISKMGGRSRDMVVNFS